MPASPHDERHFTASALVHDLVIGMSDGLTVPFALAAGLAGAVSASRLIMTAGLAELAAGAIAMGLGGFLAARGDAEHYRGEQLRESREVREKPEVEANEVYEALSPYGLTISSSSLTRSRVERLCTASRARSSASCSRPGSIGLVT